MISFYKTDSQGVLHSIPSLEKGCWVSVVAPDENEKQFLFDHCEILPEFLTAALDEQESSYIDRDDEEKQTLIIVDYPEEDTNTSGKINNFITLPIGVIFTDSCVFTVCSRTNSTLTKLQSGTVRGLDTRYKTRFLLYILLLISQEYLYDLRRIERSHQLTEKKLYANMRNQELMDIMILSKSLVYFSTSLKAEELTIQRILRSRQIPMYESDRELLDDVLIEVRQGVEMCNIYSDINAKTMDGFSNVINNNMNSIMKRLTVITLVMSIPNMVYGFYGMNVAGLPFPTALFAFILSGALCGIAWLYFKHNSGYRS